MNIALYTILMEIALILGILISACLFLILRTVNNESFLSDEYIRFQTKVVNNLDTSDFIDLDYH